MNEKKSSSDIDFNDTFSEDFDFGEGETETRYENAQTGSGLNKKVLAISAFTIISIISILGYRFYKAHSLEIHNTTKSLPTSSTPTTIALKPTPIELPPLAAPSVTTAAEANFGDIAEAFTEAEHALSAPAVTLPKAPAKESNIQDLQKELFSAEIGSKPTKTQSAATASASEAPTLSQGAELTQGLSKLNQQIEYILSQIKYLDSYTREVADNLNKLNDSIGTMDSRLSALTHTTSSLTKDVGSVKSEVGQVRQVLQEDGLELLSPGPSTSQQKAELNATKVVIEEPEYTVHAVIPGRAWLKSLKGQIITVAEGDPIGNYGKILVIDAANGVVLTSSGVAFR